MAAKPHLSGRDVRAGNLRSPVLVVDVELLYEVGIVACPGGLDLLDLLEERVKLGVVLMMNRPVHNDCHAGRMLFLAGRCRRNCASCSSWSHSNNYS